MKRILIAGAVMLSACGGRVADPVALNNSFDKKLSCTHLNGEYENHQKRLVELTGERSDKPIHNAGMFLLTGPIFLDMSQAQKNEVKAIHARNEKIATLMEARSCEMTRVPLEEEQTTETADAEK